MTEIDLFAKPSQSIQDFSREKRMASAEKQQLIISELCQRWGKSKDAIFDLALQGALPLWIGVHDIYLLPDGYQLQYEKDRIVYPTEYFFPYAEIRFDSQTLSQIKDMNGPMFIVSELSCYNEDEKRVTLVNRVDETHGQTSIIGINTSQLFARMDAVHAFEAGNGKKAVSKGGSELRHQPNAAPVSRLNSKDHAYYATELFIALDCWRALFENAGAEAKTLRKADIKVWITERYPALSATAADRIATVVTPLRKS
jgi:hypothetical protein